MPKLACISYDEPPTRRRSRSPLRWAIALAVLILPVLSEAAAVCLAQWKGLFGPIATVETPVLDTLKWLAQALAHDAHATVRAYFNNLPWKPSLVVPIGGACAALAMLILYRGQHRE
jgi:hypothetical protein